MIANDRQRRVTAAEIKRFERAIRQAKNDRPGPEVHPRIHEAMVAGMRSQLRDLRRELRDYDRLRNGETLSRTVHSLRELPVALIEGRIARRLTQRQLADRLGIPEQQVQRYEQTRYKGVSIERAQEVADVLELKLDKTVRYHPQRTGRSTTRGGKRANVSAAVERPAGLVGKRSRTSS